MNKKNLWKGLTIDNEKVYGTLDLDSEGTLYIVEIADAMCLFPVKQAIRIGQVIYDLAWDAVDELDKPVNVVFVLGRKE